MQAPDDAGRVRLPGGRGLGWAAWGPPEGAPVLFLSGAAMGRSLGFADGALLARVGARVISVDRPGLGASDPDPGRTLAGWPGDVAALCAALGLEQARMVAVSQGAPFAYACAAAGLPAALAVVSGQDDFAHPPTRALLHPEVAGLAAAAQEDPDAVEATFAASGGPDVIWDLVRRTSSAVDLAVYTAPAFAAAYRRALEEGFAQGAAGYARDLRLAVGPWPFAVQDIACPVDLWYGAHDASAVHSPDHGALLAARLPAARRHVVADAGGSLLWTHAERVLGTLLAHRPTPRSVRTRP
jgi:pimeloyl-ACP methyl ester carboxylesterase